MTKVIAISNQKGGVGKTTTAINLGAALTELGYKVLLVDCDDSNSQLTKAMLNEEADKIKPSLIELMALANVNYEAMMPQISEQAIIRHEDGFYILPSNSMLKDMNNTLTAMSDPVMSVECIKKVIRVIKEHFDFDYILLDSAPAINSLTKSVLNATDEVLLIAQAQKTSEDGLIEMLGTIAGIRKEYNPELKVTGLLITMVSGNAKSSKENAEQLREKFKGYGLKVFDTQIPRTMDAEKYIEEKKSIISYKRKSKAAEAYISLAKEFI